MNKHYFQTPNKTLGTSRYSAERQTYKAVCTSIFEHFTSGDLQFYKQAAVLPTSFDCSYCNNHNFLCPSLQRHQEKEKADRNKAENEDNKTALREGFFLEQNSVAPFLAKTCVAHTVQLRTLTQSGHNGVVAVADQGDLHQLFRTDWLPALWLPPWLQICWWPSILVQWLNSCCN